jgi:tetratricopeptide (TPR) repeat protein
MLALSIGMAIGVRVGGLLLIAYFGLFALMYWLNLYLLQRKSAQSASKKKGKKTAPLKPHVTQKDNISLAAKQDKPVVKQNLNQLFRKLAVYGLAICAVGYFIAVAVWPYAWIAPVAHVKEVYKAMSLFTISIRQLFEGQFIASTALPWYYTPKYILMTIPVAVTLGAVAYFFFGGLKRQNWFSSFVVYFAAIFPVFWIVYSNANVYGGWRHTIFAYPPMVIAAGLGFCACAKWAKRKYLKIALQILPFALLVLPVAHIIRNHPYEYVYFNKIAGGINKAYGYYEMDYYYHSTRAATEWVKQNAQKSGLERGDKIVVGSWHLHSVGHFLKNDTSQFQGEFVRWRERSITDWDYAIFTITGIAPQIIKSPHFPPANTVHTIQVDGKPICLILKRKDKFAYHAAQLRNQINDTNLTHEQRMALFSQALNQYSQALEIDPYDEVVISALADMYFSVGQLDSAAFYTDKLVEYYPSEDFLNYASNIYLQMAQRTNNQQYVNHSMNLQQQMIAVSPRNSQNYYNLAMMYARMGNPAAGEKLLKDCMKINGRIFEANYYMAIYYAQIGKGNEAVTILEKCIDRFPSHVDEIQNTLNQIRNVR